MDTNWADKIQPSGPLFILKRKHEARHKADMEQDSFRHSRLND